VFVTQTDKLIMSNLLSLEDYGYFTLAVLVASGIMMISAPISGALTPRMVKLDSEGKQEELIQLYRKSTQLVTVLAGSAAIILATFSKPILYLWTGDQHIANVASETLTLYAIGYGFLAISAFPYYLQYAKGTLKLHIVGGLLYITTLLPLLFILTHNFGMQGAGYAWLIVNILYFLTWTGYIHHIHLKGVHFSWLLKDVIQPIIISIIIAILLTKFIRTDVNQFELLMILVISTTIVTTISALSSAYLRSTLFSIFSSKYAKYKTT
jgi:O-antigen/teichoic acid export membrane protein